MATRSEFARRLAERDLSHVERAVALLYYYRESQEFEKRTPTALASDLHEEGFPRPNATRLKNDLQRSHFVVRGQQRGSFQLDLRRISELEERYGAFLERPRIEVEGHVLPNEWVTGTRLYLERMVYQINGAYQYGFYDACATLTRRLMESLIIEIYVHERRHRQIQNNGVFIPLEKLIKYVTNDPKVALARNTPRIMNDVKQLGDTGAHDRTYITAKVDIDDIKALYRRLIQELLDKAGIR